MVTYSIAPPADGKGVARGWGQRRSDRAVGFERLRPYSCFMAKEGTSLSCPLRVTNVFGDIDGYGDHEILSAFSGIQQQREQREGLLGEALLKRYARAPGLLAAVGGVAGAGRGRSVALEHYCPYSRPALRYCFISL